MVKDGQYDPMALEDSTSVLHWFHGSPTVYQWLLDQEEFLIDLNQCTSTSKSVADALIFDRGSNISQCLELVISRKRGRKTPAESFDFSEEQRLAYKALRHFSYLADELDFPNRIRVLWSAGADLYAPESPDGSGTMLDQIVLSAVFQSVKGREEDAIGYDRLEVISTTEFRPRMSKSLWNAWYPGNELSVLEVVQRHLDAWMEVLLEAGIDIAEYGRREDQLHPEGVLSDFWGEAYLVFEYGDHVNGCRIHMTEIRTKDQFRTMIYDSDDESDTSEEDDQSTTNGETSTMPCSWDFDEE